MSIEPFGKSNPFLASIKERRWLSKPGSQKHTFNIVLNLKGSGFKYSPGDSLGIFPINPPATVIRTLNAMKATGDEIITDKQGEGHFALKDFLTHKANLAGISRKFLGEVAARQQSPEKKEALEVLLSDGYKEALKAYIESHEVWDLLEENANATFSIQEIINLMMPLLPRLYSIASAQSVVGDEVHLTVSRLSYTSNQNERLGVCTYYLCDLVPLNESIIPIYIQEHHGFTLPEDTSTDIIMIGPGTGVAPFKAFMEERIATNAKGKNWLFFGECHRAFDYFYEDFWSELQNSNKLQVDTAFSRDQEQKIYVQHRMLEKGAELFSWLESGAILYVCGDAHRMARDVDAALQTIVEKYGQKNEAEAKAYIKGLRNQKRYLKDVY